MHSLKANTQATKVFSDFMGSLRTPVEHSDSDVFRSAGNTKEF